MTEKMKLRWNSNKADGAIYMCPSCFAIKNVSDLSVTANIPIRPDITVYSHQIISAIDSIIRVTCDECHDEMVRIDYPIASVISRFNSIGYHTVYCCSGHQFTNKPNMMQVLPYVMFGFDPDRLNLDKNTSNELIPKFIECVDKMYRNVKGALDYVLVREETIAKNSKNKTNVEYLRTIEIEPPTDECPLCFTVRSNNTEAEYHYSYPFKHVLNDIYMCLFGKNLRAEVDALLKAATHDCDEEEV